jgi:hypothetical protein
MPIKSYSTTAASNNAAPPNGFPEGMAPASLNDGMRQVMADIRSWYEDPAWIDLGDTPTYIGTTSFSVTGDKTATYAVGRRVRAIGTTPFTIYGTIATSVYGSVTTVTVTWDSGTLNATLSAVALNLSQAAIADLRLTNIFASGSGGVIIKNNSGTTVLTVGAGGGTGVTAAGGFNITGLTTLSAALDTAKGSDIASATTTNIGAATGNFVHVTGTTTITGLGTITAGVVRIVRFAGILTLTHNATSLILPSGANITTAANDVAVFVSEGSGNWRCVSYERASGAPLIGTSSLSTTVTLATGTPTVQDINIPANTRQFTINFANVSLNASAQPTLLLGTSGSFETTGYVSTVSFIQATVGTSTSAAAILLTSAGLPATSGLNGSVTFTLIDASTNEWSYSGTLSAPDIPSNFSISGSKPLASALTRIRATTLAGTATFDAGKANVFSVL